MPADATPRSSDHLTITEHLQILACAFEIRGNSADFMARLQYVAQRAEQEVPIAERRTLEVTWTGDEYHVRDEGEEVARELSASIALEALYNRMHRRVMDRFAGHVRIHAGSGMCRGGMFLMVGPKRSGKTTLALRLLAEGYDIAGDELVLLRDGQAVTFPRKFYVRDGSLPLLPAVQALRSMAPFVAHPAEGRLIAVDPTSFGRPWRIAPAPIAAILFIEPNHGARTTISRCGKVEMVQRIVSQSSAPESGRSDWLGDLCSAVDRAATVIVQLGELDSAMVAIGRILCEI